MQQECDLPKAKYLNLPENCIISGTINQFLTNDASFKRTCFALYPDICSNISILTTEDVRVKTKMFLLIYF